MENERVWKRLRTKGGCKRVGTLEDRGSWLTITPLPPLFFVSVASKGLSSAVSLLFATLAGKSISVAAKGFKRVDCWREGNCVGWKGRKLESRNQKLEIGKRGEWPAVGDKAKLIKRKRLSERQCQPCKLRKDGPPQHIWGVH